MTRDYDLEKGLIPLGEYRKKQFLFYDYKTSQLYAIDSYNSKSQSIWIWAGIVLVAPIFETAATYYPYSAEPFKNSISYFSNSNFC